MKYFWYELRSDHYKHGQVVEEYRPLDENPMNTKETFIADYIRRRDFDPSLKIFYCEEHEVTYIL